MSNGKVPKLACTTKYEMFELNPFNRNVIRPKDLEKSMIQHGFIAACPIHCVRGDSGKLVIKDGHHRFEVAKKLGLAVYYVVCDDEATIIQLQKSTRPWELRDYNDSFARSGSVSHIALKEFCERTGLNLSQASSVMSGRSAGTSSTSFIKSSDFQITEAGVERAELLAATVKSLSELGIEQAANQRLVAAIDSFMWLDEFNVETLVYRIRNNIAMFHRCATTEQYQDMLEKIYNHGIQRKIPLAFSAREASRKRSALYRYKSKEQSS